jgi:hypothetical protein
MSWSWLDPLSLYSAPFILTALFVGSAVLALTRTRGGWLAPLLALTFSSWQPRPPRFPGSRFLPHVSRF